MRDTLKITLASVIMGLIVFVLQLSIKPAAVSLVLLLPLGVVLHFIGLATLGVIRQNDVDMLKRIQSGLPKRLRRSYGIILRLVEKMTKMRIVPEKRN
jgi:hypothetical protein